MKQYLEYWCSPGYPGNPSTDPEGTHIGCLELEIFSVLIKYFIQETHIIWKYEQPFYGKWLKLLICGYIRPEQNYDSLRKYRYPNYLDLLFTIINLCWKYFKIIAYHGILLFLLQKA